MAVLFWLHSFNFIGNSNGCGFAAIESDIINNYNGSDPFGLPPIDPLLSQLEHKGGPTQVHALEIGSPLVDKGNCYDIDGNLISTDQRGVPRPQGSGCDIGAYELDIIDPDAPQNLALSSDDDLGDSNIDNLTSIGTDLTISGTGENMATVQTYSNGTPAGSPCTVSNDGTFSTDIFLTSGSHNITATQTDLSGNKSEHSAPLIITVDTTPPSGNITISDNNGSSNNPRPEVTVTSPDATHVRFALNNEINLGAATWIPFVSGSSHTPFDLSQSGDGEKWFLAQFRDAAGNIQTNFASDSTVYDTTPPGKPVVIGDTPTNSTTISYDWSSGGSGIGTYRFRPDSDKLSSESESTDTAYTRTVSSDGDYTLYVQEKDHAGNWSSSGSFTITVDTAPPNPPVVSASTPTSDKTPTWTWLSGGGGNRVYQYRPDDADWSGELPGITEYTPEKPLPVSDGEKETFTLHVRERDDAGNWSASGSFAILVNLSIISGPVFTEGFATVTNDTTPTWSWHSGADDGKSIFHVRLDDTPWETNMTETVYTPTSPLSEGAHTLSVQELGPSDIWSGTNTLAVEIDSGKPCSLATSPPSVSAESNPFKITYTADDIYDGEDCGNALSGSGLAKVELWVKIPGTEEYTLADTDTDTFDGEFEYTASEEGAYYFRTLATDKASNTETKSADENDTVTVYAEDFAGYAVLAVGYVSDQEGIADHTLAANNVYRHLIRRKFALSDDLSDPLDLIRYFNPYEELQPGEDDFGAADYSYALRETLEEWALEKMTALSGPLWIILIDHGGPDHFSLTGTQSLSASDISDWLEPVETYMADEGIDEPVVIVLGACFSGSFVRGLSDPDRPNRIILTSSAENEPSYRGAKDPGGNRDGEFFITSLFGMLGQGYDLGTSFEQAVMQTEIHTDSGFALRPAPYFDTARQHPHLDDNRDGQASNELSPGNDGDRAGKIFLGRGTDAPEPVRITAMGKEPDTPLVPDASQAILWADVSDADQADSLRVWIEVRDPGLTLDESDSLLQKEIELPRQSLEHDGGTRFSGTYSDFSAPGKHTVFFHVVNTETGVIFPGEQLVIYKGKVGNRPPSGFSAVYPEHEKSVRTTGLLHWEDATDPDGDQITYTVLISEKENDFSNAARREGLEYTTYQITGADGLKDRSDYFWKVQAVDEYGDFSETDVRKFSTDDNNPIAALIRGFVYNTQTNQPLMNALITVIIRLNNAVISMLEERTDQRGHYFGSLFEDPENPADALSSANAEVTITVGDEIFTNSVTVVFDDLVRKDFGVACEGCTRLRGDVNGDNLIDLTDAVSGLNMLATQEKCDIELEDVAVALRVSAGLE